MLRKYRLFEKKGRKRIRKKRKKKKYIILFVTAVSNRFLQISRFFFSISYLFSTVQHIYFCKMLQLKTPP